MKALSDLTKAWCIRAAVTLGIPKQMPAGLRDVRELAAAARCDAQVLAGVLAHLVGRGVFEEAGEGRFVLNDAATGLGEPVQELWLDLEAIVGRIALAWAACSPTCGPVNPGTRRCSVARCVGLEADLEAVRAFFGEPVQAVREQHASETASLVVVLDPHRLDETGSASSSVGRGRRKVTGAGVVISTYEPAGPVRYRSWAAE